MWVYFKDNNGKEWLIDQIGMWMLVRQYIYAKLLNDQSKIVTTKNWFGPDMSTVETDFSAIRATRDQLSQDAFTGIETEVLKDAKGAYNSLIQMRSEMDDYSASFKDMQKRASRDTMQAINTSVARSQAAIDVLTVVRDLSATTLVVGAGFLSGGAALGVLGAGSALKGTARYQDSGNIGSAILEASGTFVFGMITMAPSIAEVGAAPGLMSRATAPALATSGQRMGMVIIGAQMDATFEGVKSAMEGGTAKEAITRAGVRFATDIASGAAGIKLDKLALPIAARLLTDTGAAVASDKSGNYAAGKVKPPVVTAKVLPIRDCNPTTPSAPNDEDYIQSVAMRAL
jgi:hypothetical protein